MSRLSIQAISMLICGFAATRTTGSDCSVLFYRTTVGKPKQTKASTWGVSTSTGKGSWLPVRRVKPARDGIRQGSEWKWFLRERRVLLVRYAATGRVLHVRPQVAHVAL